MSDAVTGVSAPTDPHGGQRQDRRTSKVGREEARLLLGLPIVCLLVLGAWAVWRVSADLDAIEQTALEWNLIFRYVREHILLTVIGAACVIATAIPTGILLTRGGGGRFTVPVVAFANIWQAAPVIGILALLAIWLGFGLWVAVLAFSLYAFLPVLSNTIVGLQGVDRTLIEAGRGMGMSAAMVLLRVELPLAMPVIMNGVRTALVLVVGTAAFATFINAGGLGALIVTGITLFRMPVLVTGGILISVLALLVDWVGRVMEMVATPKGAR